MLGNLFKNPKAALAYVGITVFGVLLFVGTEDDPGSLSQTVDPIGGGDRASEQEVERKFGDPPPGENIVAKRPERDEEKVYTFASDDELIDDASGFNPSPTGSFGGFDPTPPEGGPYLDKQDDLLPEDASGGWREDADSEDEVR